QLCRAALGCLPTRESACHSERGCSASTCPFPVFPPSVQGSQCTAAELLRQGQAPRGAGAAPETDAWPSCWCAQRTPCWPGAAARTVASAGRRAGQAGRGAGGPRSQAWRVPGEKRRTLGPDETRAWAGGPWGGTVPWGVATFASCRLCQGWFGRGHGWDGDDWAPQALPLLV